MSVMYIAIFSIFQKSLTDKKVNVDSTIFHDVENIELDFSLAVG